MESQPGSPNDALAWWQRGVFYQIWVRSYFDSNGDGNGDLAGLISKLEYLRWLGVDVLWLSPIFPSPLIEGGYDVSDYTGVHELFGSLDDFDRLLAEAHGMGMKVILDFVPNHSSDAHPWFIAARSSRDNPQRDWYIWADPRPDGKEPNNWVGCFGGSAWTYDKDSGQFYYHAFLPQQPDLNWRNPRLREAFFDTMRFWLDRGVDGFRMDAIWHLIKDDQLRDNPPNPDYRPELPPDNVVRSEFTRDRPEVHEVIAEMRRVVDGYDDRLLSGEIYLGLDRMMAYYGSPGAPELHMPFNLQLSVMPWNGREIGEYIGGYLEALGTRGWPNWAVGTHDAARIASRAGESQAPIAAMLLLSLPGTPTIYYGDEIGMTSVEIPREEIQDPRELLVPYRDLGRDPSRTPMQWNAEPSAGFSAGEPWLPVGDSSEQLNVNIQSEQPASLLNLYRRLIELRRKLSALSGGGLRLLRTEDTLLVYERSNAGQRLLVALNFGDQPQHVELELAESGGRIMLSTGMGRVDELLGNSFDLGPAEGLLIELDSSEPLARD